MFLNINRLLLVVVIATILQLFSFEARMVSAQEDDGPPNTAQFDETETETNKQTDETEKDSSTEFTDEPDAPTLRPSPYAETSIVFVQPPGASELPGGKEVKVIAGFYNKGDKDFYVDRIEAALHYPLDYNYHVQNFTTVLYGRAVPVGHDSSFDYSFMPSEMLSSRSLGLVISVFYSDTDGRQYLSAVHNSTVNIYEPDEGFDGETFFLYLTLTALTILALVGGHHYIVTAGLRRLKSSKSRQQVETGTQGNKSDIDYDWLPETALGTLNKSGGGSPKGRSSPRLRAAAIKRKSGADN